MAQDSCSRSPFEACGLVHLLWLALQLRQFSIGREISDYLLGYPALYEVLSCDVSLLRSSSLHRLPCRLKMMIKQVQVLVGCWGFQACPVRPQAEYASGLDSLYYRAVTEPHLAVCDKKLLLAFIIL